MVTLSGGGSLFLLPKSDSRAHPIESIVGLVQGVAGVANFGNGNGGNRAGFLSDGVGFVNGGSGFACGGGSGSDGGGGGGVGRVVDPRQARAAARPPVQVCVYILYERHGCSIPRTDQSDDRFPLQLMTQVYQAGQI